MSRGSGETGRKKAPPKRKEELGRKKVSTSSEMSGGGSGSGRGERERTKWRKRKRERELKKAEELMEQKRIEAIEEAEKRKQESEKTRVKMMLEENEKLLQEAEMNQRTVETVITDYRESKNLVKFNVKSHSDEIVQIQQLETSHLTDFSLQIHQSEMQITKLEAELAKSKQIRDDYINDMGQNWFRRFWKWLY